MFLSPIFLHLKNFFQGVSNNIIPDYQEVDMLKSVHAASAYSLV